MSVIDNDKYQREFVMWQDRINKLVEGMADIDRPEYTIGKYMAVHGILKRMKGAKDANPNHDLRRDRGIHAQGRGRA